MTAIRLHAATLALVVVESTAFAQAPDAYTESQSIQALKATYLACDRATSASRMDPSVAGQCMSVSDELMRRAFEGDFDRLIVWWRAEKARAAQASAQ